MMKKCYFPIFMGLLMMAIGFSFQACSKKQVKTEEGGAGKMKKEGIVEIGYSGAMQTIYFEFDKYTLSDEAREILKENAQWLKSKKSIKVQVEGHCDNRGSEEYNLALGQKRAESVRKYLLDLGVAASRLTTLSYGEEKPLDKIDAEEAWSKNRRAEFIIITT